MLKVKLGLPPKDFFRNPPFITLYIKKSPHIRSRKEISEEAYKLISSALKESALKFPFSIGRELFETLSDIKFKNALFLINSAGEVYKRGIPFETFENKVFIGNFPKIRPYLKTASFFENLLVCLVERSKAEFFALNENDFSSLGWLSEEVPKKVKYGGLLGFEENRIRRHVEHHELIFLEKVARVCNELAQSQKINLIGIGLKDEFKSEVEKVFKKNLIDYKYFYFSASLTDTISELIFKLTNKLEELKRDELNQIINSSSLAVVSEEELIERFNSRQVRVLILDKSKTLPGYFCPNDFFVSTVDQSCRFCSNKLYRHDDIFEVISTALYYDGGKSCFNESADIMIIPKAS